MRRKVRKLRHWKQRFNKNAEFVWRRPVTYAGEKRAPGDPIPDTLTSNKTKLRRFWESGAIELAQFEEPNVLTGLTVSKEAMRQLELMRIRNRRAAEDFVRADEAEELRSRTDRVETAKADFEEFGPNGGNDLTEEGADRGD